MSSAEMIHVPDLPKGVQLQEKEYLLLGEHPMVMFFLRLGGGSFLIWIGPKNSSTKFNSLALALATNSTSVIAHNDLFSPGLAKKLSLKFNQNKPVYVSYNYPDLKYRNDDLLLEVNQKIIEFVKLCIA